MSFSESDHGLARRGEDFPWDGPNTRVYAVGLGLKGVTTDQVKDSGAEILQTRSTDAAAGCRASGELADFIR